MKDAGEYIEREAAIKLVKGTGYADPIKDNLLFILRTIPSADVRTVVLCKDCKHRFMTPNGWHCPYAEWGIEDDDFCSCGEKREEN